MLRVCVTGDVITGVLLLVSDVCFCVWAFGTDACMGMLPLSALELCGHAGWGSGSSENHRGPAPAGLRWTAVLGGVQGSLELMGRCDRLSKAGVCRDLR